MELTVLVNQSSLFKEVLTEVFDVLYSYSYEKLTDKERAQSVLHEAILAAYDLSLIHIFRRIDSLRPLFEGIQGQDVTVLHTAGVIDISEDLSPRMYDVNVNGTKNMIALCKEYGVKRMLYVSSVHAIPEGDRLKVLREVKRFSPDWVIGGYAKTKAEATQAVLDAVGEGLDLSLIHI